MATHRLTLVRAVRELLALATAPRLSPDEAKIAAEVLRLLGGPQRRASKEHDSRAALTLVDDLAATYRRTVSLESRSKMKTSGRVHERAEEVRTAVRDWAANTGYTDHHALKPATLKHLDLDAAQIRSCGGPKDAAAKMAEFAIGVSVRSTYGRRAAGLKPLTPLEGPSASAGNREFVAQLAIALEALGVPDSRATGKAEAIARVLRGR